MQNEFNLAEAVARKTSATSAIAVRTITDANNSKTTPHTRFTTPTCAATAPSSLTLINDCVYSRPVLAKCRVEVRFQAVSKEGQAAWDRQADPEGSVSSSHHGT